MTAGEENFAIFFCPPFKNGAVESPLLFSNPEFEKFEIRL